MANAERKPWDKDAAVTLRGEGKTTGQIAALLGVTRNAVVGLLYRRNLIGEDAPPETRKVRTRKPAPPPRPKIVKEKKAAKPVAPAPQKPASSVNVGIRKYSRDDVTVTIERATESRGFRIIELGSKQCRCATSPHDVDKRSHVFCGDVCDEGEMYCNSHRKKLYKTGQKPKKKQPRATNYFEQQKATI